MSQLRRLIMTLNKPVVVDDCIRGVYYAADSTTSRVVACTAGQFDWATVDGVQLASPTTATVMSEGLHNVVLHIKSATSLRLGSMFRTLPYTSLDLSTAGLSNRALNMGNAMDSMTYLKSLNLGPYDFGTCANLYEAFYADSALVIDDTSGFNLTNATVLTRAFRGVASTKWNCAKWNCSKVTNAKGLFYQALASTDVVDMEAWQCPSLTNLDEAFRNNSNAFVVRMPRALDPSKCSFQYAFLVAGVANVYVPSAQLDAYKTAMANANITLSKIVAYTD